MKKTVKTPRKTVRIRVYSTYSESTRPWYVTKKRMTKKEYDRYVKDWRVKEFARDLSWRAKGGTHSWREGVINTLSD
jgi:hypothetical protein